MFCVLNLCTFLFSINFNYFFCEQNLFFTFCIIGLTTTRSMFYLLEEGVFGLLGDVFYGEYDVS